MNLENFKSMTSQERYLLLKEIRPGIKLSSVEIARMANVSTGLVSMFFAGMSTNDEILKIVREAISEVA